MTNVFSIQLLNNDCFLYHTISVPSSSDNIRSFSSCVFLSGDTTSLLRSSEERDTENTFSRMYVLTFAGRRGGYLWVLPY